MNKIFKILWSSEKGTFVVTHERVKSRGNTGSILNNSTTVRFKLSSLTLFILLSFSNHVWGQSVVNPVVTAGSANVNLSNPAKVVVNQQSDKAVINWKEFSIPRQNSVTFKQPGSQSITLNRVTGRHQSEIHGSLEANGQVWLLNPNGTLIGKYGTVNAHGFMATTANISDQNFMRGNYEFKTKKYSESKIRNLGVIDVNDNGYTILAAGSVINDGLIVARFGKITLGSGEAYTIDVVGDELLSFEINIPLSDKNQKGVENFGKLSANGGLIMLTAKAVDALMHDIVNTNGLVEATSIEQKNGVIILSAGDSSKIKVSGIVDASGKNPGETGGYVEIFGRDISLSDSFIDVTGEFSGGKVLIGGGWKGSKVGNNNPAKKVTVDVNSIIDASATTSGDGGDIVIWSDVPDPASETRVHGDLRADGGGFLGNGGRIETSGYSLFTRDIRVSTKSLTGATGLWLLDPGTITIANGTDNHALSGSTFSYSNNDANGFVHGQTLNNALSASNVTIEADNIILGESYNDTYSTTLTLAADSAITLTGSFNRSNGSISLNAGTTLSGSGGLACGVECTISVGSESIYSGVISGSGSLTKSGAGALMLKATNTYTGGTTISAGTIVVTSSDTFGSQSSQLTLIDGTTIKGAVNDFININNPINLPSGTVTIEVSFTGGSASFAGESSHRLNRDLIFGGVISGNGGLKVISTSGARYVEFAKSNTFIGGVTLGDGTSNRPRIILSNSNGLGAGTLTYNSTSTAYETGFDSLTLNGSLTIPNNLSLTSGTTMYLSSGASGDDDFTGNISGGGSIKKQHGSHNVSFSGSNGSFAGVATVTSGGFKAGSQTTPFGTGKIVVEGGAFFDLNGKTLSNAFDLQGIGPSGAGALINSNTGQAGFINSSGGIELRAASGDTTVAIGGDSDFIIGANIDEASGTSNAVIRKVGSGSVELEASNQFSGGVTISAGTLIVDHTNAIPSAGLINFSGGTLQITSNSPTFASSRFDTSSADLKISVGSGLNYTLADLQTSKKVIKSGSGDLVLIGNTQIANGVELTEGSGAIGDNSTTTSFSGNLTLGTNTTMNFAPASSMDFNGDVSGAGSLIVQGGTLKYTGDATHTGGTDLSGNAIFEIGVGSFSGADNGSVTGLITSDSSSKLALNFDSNQIVTATINSMGTIQQMGTGEVKLSGISTHDGPTIIDSGTLNIDVSDSNTTLSLTGAISGDGKLKKSGSGILSLAGSNIFGGGIILSGGMLVANNTNAIPSSGSITFEGGTFGFSSNNNNDVSSRFAFTSLTDDLSLHIPTGVDVTLASGFSRSDLGAKLIKKGGGKLRLGATNSFGGGADVDGGEIFIGVGSSQGSLDNNVKLTTSSSRLIFDRSGNVNFSGIITGTGIVEQVNTGTLILAGINSYTGDTLVSNGSLTVKGAITGNLGVVSGSAANFNFASDTTYSGDITGAGTVANIGAGALDLSGTIAATITTTSNSGAGAITVSSGGGGNNDSGNNDSGNNDSGNNDSGNNFSGSENDIPVEVTAPQDFSDPIFSGDQPLAVDDVCAIDPFLCSDNVSNRGDDVFDPSIFFGGAPNLVPDSELSGSAILFPQDENFDAFLNGDPNSITGVSSELPKYETTDFFDALATTGLQGEDLSNAFNNFDSPDYFIDTAKFAGTLGVDFGEVAEFAAEIDRSAFQDASRLTEAGFVDFSEIQEFSGKVDAEIFAGTANLAADLGFNFNEVADIAQNLDNEVFLEAAEVTGEFGIDFFEVAQVAERVDLSLLDDLASIAGEGGSVIEVFDNAMDEANNIVRSSGGSPQLVEPEIDIQTETREFAPQGGQVGGGGEDFGILGGEPSGEFGDVTGVPPGDFEVPANIDFDAPEGFGGFGGPVPLELGNIEELGGEIGDFGDFNEFGDAVEISPIETPIESSGVSPSGDITPEPGTDTANNPPEGNVSDSSTNQDSTPIGADAPGSEEGPAIADSDESPRQTDDTAPTENSADEQVTEDLTAASDNTEDSGLNSQQSAGDTPTEDGPAQSADGDAPPTLTANSDDGTSPDAAAAQSAPLTAVTADAAPPPAPPVTPPPPSPVPTQKAPTPVDSADAGDKTLAAVSSPKPPKPAKQAQAVSIKTIPVVPGGVINVQVPVAPRPPSGTATTQKIPSVGNSSNW